MSVREDLLQAARGAIKAALTLTDAQVIPADDKGPRPPLPYLTVKITTAGGSSGYHPEDIPGCDGVTGDPTTKGRASYVATASVQGFGATAAGWLDELPLRLRRPAVLDTLATVAVRPLGGVVDVSALLDTEIEHRYALDLEVAYAVEDDPVSLTEALTVETEYTGESDTPGDLTVTIITP